MKPELYQFPATRFISNSPWKQWWNMFSEVMEIGLALLVGNLQHAAVETGDLKQSGETMHKILGGRGADIQLAMDTVLEKNQARGYYLPIPVKCSYEAAADCFDGLDYRPYRPFGEIPPKSSPAVEEKQ